MSASPTEETHGESGLMDGIPADRQDGGAIDGSIYDVPGFMFVDWMCYRAGCFEEAGLDPPRRFPGSPGWERNVILPTFQRVLLGELTPEAGVEVMMAGLEEAVNG